eukprot:1160808-Pelagomonas_calceolata.AAC.18
MALEDCTQALKPRYAQRRVMSRCVPGACLKCTHCTPALHHAHKTSVGVFNSLNCLNTQLCFEDYPTHGMHPLALPWAGNGSHGAFRSRDVAYSKSVAAKGVRFNSMVPQGPSDGRGSHMMLRALLGNIPLYAVRWQTSIHVPESSS